MFVPLNEYLEEKFDIDFKNVFFDNLNRYAKSIGIKINKKDILVEKNTDDSLLGGYYFPGDEEIVLAETLFKKETNICDFVEISKTIIHEFAHKKYFENSKIKDILRSKNILFFEGINKKNSDFNKTREYLFNSHSIIEYNYDFKNKFFSKVIFDLKNDTKEIKKLYDCILYDLFNCEYLDQIFFLGSFSEMISFTCENIIFDPHINSKEILQRFNDPYFLSYSLLYFGYDRAYLSPEINSNKEIINTLVDTRKLNKTIRLCARMINEFDPVEIIGKNKIRDLSKLF